MNHSVHELPQGESQKRLTEEERGGRNKEVRERCIVWDKQFCYVTDMNHASFHFWQKKKRRKTENHVLTKFPEKVKKVCKHDIYIIGETYKEEGHPGYWEKNQWYAGTSCAGKKCKRKIVATVKDGCFKPSSSKPAYVCAAGVVENCEHCLCYDCFTEKIKDQSAGENKGVADPNRRPQRRGRQMRN